MIHHLNQARRTSLLLILLFIVSAKAFANLSVINFAKAGYPKTLQAQVDYLVANQNLYVHWVPEWKETIPKDEVIAKLTALYTELEKLPANNLETTLLMGDVAHFLYNLDAKGFYQKAVDQYEAAQKINPNDYRVYWFLGNHYALSAVTAKSITTYSAALSHLPTSNTSAYFWADYSNACMMADMPATAVYAAHQSSVVSGARTYAEETASRFKKTSLHAPPADTALAQNQMWYLKKQKDIKWKFTNYALGFKLIIDSTWNLRPTPLKDGGAFALMVAPRIKSASGAEIGFSIMVYAKVAPPNQDMEQFMDDFALKYPNKKPITFDVSGIKNCIAYEITDPKIYPQWGGARMYAVALERDRSEYPGMALEEPVERPAGNGQVQYYRSNRTFSRFNGKMRYMIMLDSCEAISKESLAAFKEFLEKGLVIE